MTTETNSTVYDVLVAPAEQGGRLSKVATAYPTAKGAGFRCTLKAALPEGVQLLILPSRTRAAQPQPAPAEDAA